MLHVDVLIIGAGPTGMAAALALSKEGKNILIIDKREKGMGFSRTILVNTYTLKALEIYGITKKIHERSWPVKSVSFIGTKGALLDADFSDQLKRSTINPVTLVQMETEQCMSEVLEEKGVHIKRPFQLVGFTQDAEGVTATIEHCKDATEQFTVRADYMLGCDGYHSETRKLLGIEYNEKDFGHKMFGVDVEMKWPYKSDVATWLLDEGAMIGIRVSENKVRFGGLPDELLSTIQHLPGFEKITWQSEFDIHFAQVKEYGKGRVWLAGDAAHVHSPIGGRGMNMGIADGLRLAKAVLDGDFIAYQKERYIVNSNWVNTNRKLTKFILSKGAIGKIKRKLVRLFISMASLVSKRKVTETIFQRVSGS